MIFNLLINFLLLFFGGISSFLPVVTIASIPIAGSFISSVLITAVQVFNAFLGTFPFAIIVWHMFLWVVLPFEFLLLIAKFFFGHHVPAQMN